MWEKANLETEIRGRYSRFLLRNQIDGSINPVFPGRRL